MTLPTLSKTWQYAVNQPQTQGNSSSPGYCSYVMYDLKESLVGFSSNPWSVVRSSDGSSVSTGDLWADGGDAVHWDGGTTPSGWVVLQQNAISTGFQLLIWPRNNSGGNQSVVEMYISEAAGFTGGSANGTRPTATDEVDVWNAEGQPEWTDRVALDTVPGVLHVMQSTDGEITRFWLYMNGVVKMWCNIEKPRDAVSGWTIPWICTMASSEYGGTDFQPIYGHLNDINTITACRAGGVPTAHCYYTSESCISSMLGEQQITGAELDSNSYPFFPIGLFSQDVGARGRLGALTDIWWASTATGDGDYYPADLTRQLVQVGDVIMPWNGSAMARI